MQLPQVTSVGATLGQPPFDHLQSFPPFMAHSSLPPHPPGMAPPTGPPQFHSYPLYPPYAYNMPFSTAQQHAHGTPMTNGYPPSHAQMPSQAYPMTGYYHSGYGPQPPPMQ